MNTDRSAWPRWLFGFTILLSAFLLFQVQPIISKAILPWFGGSPAVWSTCLLFFQVLLLGGYAYAHWLAGRTERAGLVWLHVGLLVVAVALLPITPSAAWKPTGDENPTAYILLLLGVSIGLPYFLLSATGPLLQAWYFRWSRGHSPYRLYALSNVGSLGALLTYPFLVEPAWSISWQGRLWSLLFGGFVVACSAVAWCYWGAERGRSRGALREESSEPASATRTQTAEPRELENPEAEYPEVEARDIPNRAAGRSGGARELADTELADTELAEDRGPVTAMRMLSWVALPAFASLMLLAVTAHISQDVAVVPFLWLLPLSLYLLSFIICFDRPLWYRRRILSGLLVGNVVLIAVLLEAHAINDFLKDLLDRGGWSDSGFAWELPEFIDHLFLEMGVFASLLFLLCLVCHGEVYRTRPGGHEVTRFYLLIAAGGALGGVLVTLVFPKLFVSHVELYAGVLAAGGLGAWVLSGRCRGWVKVLATACAVVILAPPIWWAATEGAGNILVARRNFFGTLQVTERGKGTEFHRYSLYNGRILHGMQFADEKRRRVPTLYYAEDTGIAVALLHHPRRGGLRVGAVGLGAGTLAAYGQPGDHYTFYEINPQVVDLARERFSFWSDSPARVDVVLGDARLSLERQTPQAFDVLALDAFTGDAIPVHLLTEEAFQEYRRHLAVGGIIAVHISNRHLELEPVVYAAAMYHGFRVLLVTAHDGRGVADSHSDWLLLTDSDEFCEDPDVLMSSEEIIELDRPLVYWTDDYSSLWQILD